MKTTLYLVRHALPESIDYRNRPDPGLSERGRRQAQQIAAFLAEKNIQALWCSANKRAKQTLAAFLQNSPLASSYCEALKERQPHLESHERLLQRVHQWWAQHRAEALERNTAIFGHCGTLNMILTYEDPEKKQLAYSFTDKYLCHTPISGIWALDFEQAVLQGGRLVARFDED